MIKASEFKAKCLAVLDEVERTRQPIVITKRGNPADRFIVATAIAHDAMLVTADDRLLQWRHGLRRHNAET
jgi:PIN domain nuclease of toxin-antitoxin system